MKWGVVLLVLTTVGATEPARAQAPVRIVGDAVSPPAFLPGAPAHRQLRVEAPDGVRVQVDVPDPLGSDAEAAGDVHVARSVTEAGTVLWTFQVPLTGWQTGDGQLEPIAIRWEGLGLNGGTMSEPAEFSIQDPLPDGGNLPPAAMESPFRQGGLRWDLFPLAPLALAGLTGAGWWRAGRKRDPTGDIQAASSSEDGAAVDVDDLLVRALEHIPVDVGAAVLLMADAGRALPREWGVPLSDSMTPREVAVSLRSVEEIRPVAVLVNLLYMADAWQFGRQLPPADIVRDIGESLRVGVGAPAGRSGAVEVSSA